MSTDNTRDGLTNHARAALSWLWIAGALLASAALALLATLPVLPTHADAALRWVDEGSFQLTWAGELLFFATIAWGTGAAGVAAVRRAYSPLRHIIALVALVVTLMSFVVILLALGRLVYPIVDVALSADTVVLLASVAAGGVHLALLGLAIAAIALPVPMRSTVARRSVAAVRIAVGITFIVGSYPWLLPMWLNVLVAGLVAGWGVLVGRTLLTRDRVPNPEIARASD